MMAFMMMLGFVKVHQLRHHEFSFNAYFIMWYLLVPMLLVSIYVNVSYAGRIVVYSVFVLFHLFTLVTFYADMYLGQGQMQSWSFFKSWCFQECIIYYMLNMKHVFIPFIPIKLFSYFCVIFIFFLPFFPFLFFHFIKFLLPLVYILTHSLTHLRLLCLLLNPM